MIESMVTATARNIGALLRGKQAVEQATWNAVCLVVYDRAGYGASGAATGPRDAQTADRELSGLLAQIGVSGPYVLVGHSLGGLFAEYYAARRLHEVVGLILEDSRPAAFTRRCVTAGVRMCAAPASMVRFMPSGAQAEFAALARTIAQVETSVPVRGRNVLVLSRSVEPNATAFDRIWAAGQHDLALRYPGSRHLVASRSGHYVHRDQAHWFVASVVEFLGDVRREQAVP